MRILLISQFFAPDITAAAFRLTDFARLLSSRGHDVHVITSYPHKAQVEGVDDDVFRRAGIQIDRCRVKDVVGSGARAYLKHYLSFVRGSIRRGIGIWRAGWRPDVIYASSPPLFVGMTARFLSTVFRRPWIFEVRDIWPDTAVAAGQLNPDGRAYQIGRRMEKYFYRTANHIICVSQPMAAYLATETKTPVTVIYNGVPVDNLGTASNDANDKLARKTILYAGNLGHLQELELLIEGYSEVHRLGKLDGWQLHLLGAGAQLVRLKRMVSDRDLEASVVFHAAASRDEAMAMMRDCGLLYLNLKRSPTLARTIPSKLFDYMLAARPIVAGLEGEGRTLLESTGANVIFEPGDKQALKTALTNAVADLPTLEQRSRENRALVLERFTRVKAVDLLEQVFESLTTSKARGK